MIVAGRAHREFDGRWVPAPGLTEVAEIWFDSEREPVITWSAEGTSFSLADPHDPSAMLPLAHVADRVDDPAELAKVLAEGLAACDFPPTLGAAHPDHVRKALLAARIDVSIVR